MVQVMGICTQNFAQRHTYTCAAQWRFKRTILKSMDTLTRTEKSYNHCTAQLYNKLSALTSKSHDRKVRVSGSCSSLPSPPFTLSPHCLSPQVKGQPAKSPLRAILQTHFHIIFVSVYRKRN